MSKLDERELDRLMSSAYDLLRAGREADAEAAFTRAARLVPEWSVPWYELGLLCKYQGRWAESLLYNRRAAELDPSDQASWWNLGIAATAAGNWPTARRAWDACGIPLPPGEGPPDGDLGLVPVRLHPHEAGEVVWADRIDPARARIANVPLPASSFRWRDVVLHDGAAEGHRMLHGREVPVFNVLTRLARSEYPTFVVELGSADGSSIEALEAIAAELGGAVEDWRTATRILCRECSYGIPHVHPDEADPPAHPHCGLAARDEAHARRILDRWLAEVPETDVVRWTLPDVPGPPA